MAEKVQSHPSSEGPAVHHQTPRASNSFQQSRDLLNRHISKIPQKAPEKQAQTSHLYIKFVITIRLIGVIGENVLILSFSHNCHFP